MILDDILAMKRSEILQRKSSIPLAELRDRAQWHEARRGFARALRAAPRRCIIAEIKKASPSRGVIRELFDPALHARQYQAAGATCISVLTDAPFFQGSLAHLESARAACSLPLIRKDFIVDSYQIAEARAFGADAILLIVAALEPKQLQSLMAVAIAEGLDVLTEVHDEADLEIAVAAGADPIGINNRDLRTFQTSTEVTRRLVPSIPAGTTIISESGLGEIEELRALEQVGVHGFLIGESLMAAADPGAELAAILQA